MEYRIYTEKIREQLEKMSEADKTEWIYSQARTADEDNRQSFLDSLAGNIRTEMELTPEEINRWCEAVENEEIYFEREWEEDQDSLFSWDPDYVEYYTDEYGIKNFLAKALDTCRQLISLRKYSTAYPLLARLAALEFCICDEFPEYMTLAALEKNGAVRIDFRELMKALLYSCYQSCDGRERIDRIYSHISEYNDINITGILSYGPEELQGTDEFMTEWRSFLMNRKDEAACGLLKEACMYIGGEELLFETAGKKAGDFPELYADYCRMMYDSGQYDRCIEAAKEAISRIESSSPVCSTVSDLAIKAGEDRPHLIKNFCFSAFCGRPDMFNLLRLFAAGDSETLKQALAVIKSMEQGRLKWMFRFMTGEYEEVIRHCMSRQDDSEMKDDIIYLLFIALKEDKAAKTAAEKAVIDEIMHRSGFARSERNQYYRMMSAWRKNFKISEDKIAEYISRLKDETDRYVDMTVGGGHRESYDRAALRVVMLGEVLEDNGMENGLSEIIEGYRKTYWRKHAFTGELSEAAKKSEV